MRDGYGVYTFSDGSTYSGQWKADKMHGKGVYTTKGGRTYEGQWNNGNKVK
jgi:hypothetical protein